MEWLRRLVREEAGSSIVLFAVFTPALFGALALVIDVGVLLMNQATLQNAADAAAMAGAAYLPVAPSSATTVAIQYATANGVSIGAGDVAVTTRYAANDTIVVQAQRSVAFQFGVVAGVTSAQARATAQATVGSLPQDNQIIPWGLVDTNPSPGVFGYSYGQSVTLRLGDRDLGDGNFQALGVDGTGADLYREAIGRGSINGVSIGSSVTTLTGVMHGPTIQGIGDRVGSNSQSFADVVAANGDGTYRVLDWNSPRLGVVPVITGLVSPGAPAQVIAFSVFFIESWRVQGGTAEVTGKFLDTVPPGGNWIPYQGSYGERVVRLAQ